MQKKEKKGYKNLSMYIFVKTLTDLRYFIFISYKGTSYHGWQIQPDSVTVQKILDEALTTMLSENISSTGAGRTDTGVHAMFFCAHFDTISADLDRNKNFIHKLNSYLPKDIAVTSLRKVRPDANARFSALTRTYQYYISREKDPFYDDSSWHLYGDINVKAMNDAAALLMKYTDFTSFAKLHTNVKTNNCKIFSAGWEENRNLLIFTIKADRFLRNMVRSIVGTITDIGFGKMDLNKFEEIIRARDRCKAGKSAPAKGLFLTWIEYPADIYL
jgi:tRNA pseudouridine38-40 synthase